MPRALLLCEFPALNGGERSLLAVLPSLQQAGWEFDAWCPGAGPLAESFSAIGIRVIPHRPIVASVTSLEARRADLAAVLSAGAKYDLVHANSLSMGRLSGPVVESAGVPSISHMRDIVGLNKTAIADLNRHTRLLTVSEAVSKHHVAQGLAADKAYVVYNGIDLQLFKPATPSGYLQKELRLLPESRMIVIVGQFIVRKGLDVALTAAIEAMSKRSDVITLVVGTRHSEKAETVELEKHLRSLAEGTYKAVHFLGTRSDLSKLLRECTLLVHTPRQEPLGRVLLEAGACGLPIVTTDVGGTREIFPRGERDGAILVPVDDVAKTRMAIGLILDRDELMCDLSVAAHERIATAFSVEQSAVALLHHYTEVSGR